MKTHIRFYIALCSFYMLMLAGCVRTLNVPTLPNPPATINNSSSSTPTSTASSTSTGTPTATLFITDSPTSTYSVTATPTATGTPVPTQTFSPTPSTPSVTPTITYLCPTPVGQFAYGQQTVHEKELPGVMGANDSCATQEGYGVFYSQVNVIGYLSATAGGNPTYAGSDRDFYSFTNSGNGVQRGFQFGCFGGNQYHLIEYPCTGMPITYTGPVTFEGLLPNPTDFEVVGLSGSPGYYMLSYWEQRDATYTPTNSPTPMDTATPTHTPTKCIPCSATATSTQPYTRTPSDTPTGTLTPSNTFTPTGSATLTPTPTPTGTWYTPTPTPT